MIRINCTQCQTTLTIDDAFAGGVCRCQHCGAIQTVPARSKSTRPAAPVPSSSSGTIYQAGARSGSGLRQLSDTVPSSGSISGAGKASNRVRGLAPVVPGPLSEQPVRSSHLLPWLFAAGGVIVALIGVLIWMGLRGPGTPTQAGADAGPASNAPVTSTTPELLPAKSPVSTPVSGEIAVPTFGPAPTLFVPSANQLAKAGEPQFYGVRLEGSSVSYVLDRNESMGGSAFDDVRSALYRSIESLKPGQQFRVVFTGKKGEPSVWPQTGFADASKDNVAAFRKVADGLKLVKDGDLQPQEAFAKALNNAPAILVFATSRSGYDERAAGSWLGQGGAPKGTKVFGFNLSGTNKTSRALKKLADSTHGLYRELSTDDLRTFAHGRG